MFYIIMKACSLCIYLISMNNKSNCFMFTDKKGLSNFISVKLNGLHKCRNY